MDRDRPPSYGDGLAALAKLPGIVAGGAARRLRGLLPASDRVDELDRRDPDFMREWMPAMWLLTSLYFRAEIRGITNVPRSGPVLLVSNHTGGNQAPEILVNVLAFPSYWGVERPFYSLAHKLVLSNPAGPFLRRFGTIEASPENAEQALDADAAVIVYPGGDYEVFRPSWESAKVDFGGRKGWIRLALKRGVPVVPLVTIGGQETALYLTRGEGLARLLRLDRLARLKTFPVIVAPPFGLNLGLQASIPLPAKIVVEALEPIDLRERYEADPDVDVIYDDILREMQAKLTALQVERRFPIIG